MQHGLWLGTNNQTLQLFHLCLTEFRCMCTKLQVCKLITRVVRDTETMTGQHRILVLSDPEGVHKGSSG